jgi:acetylglutamate synthase
MTIAIGIIFGLFFPPSVGNGKPLISFGKWSYFNSREEYILVRRVLLDDPGKTAAHLSISGGDVWLTVRNPRVLVHVLITLMSIISASAINVYAPSIIKSLGFSAVQANALFSVGNLIAAVIVLVLGYIALVYNFSWYDIGCLH